MSNHIHRLSKNDNEITVFIICGEYTIYKSSHRPRCFFTKNKQTLISHAIEKVKQEYPSSSIVVSGGNHFEELKKYRESKVRFVENTNFSETGTCEELRLCINNREAEKVLLIYGDVLFNRQSIRGFDVNKNSLVVSQNMCDLCVGVGYDKEVINMRYDITKNKWGYIAFFSNDCVSFFENNLKSNSREEIHEAINYAIEKGIKFYPHSSKTSEIKRFYSKESNENSN